MKNLILSVSVSVMLVACATKPPSLANGNCGIDPETLECTCLGSPIVFDLAGDGVHLSAAQDGVTFALQGKPRQWSWTLPGSDDAWLAIDLNDNGTIDSGAELFGDYGTADGFAALSKYDDNGDGRIDRADAVWSRLRLWQDRNHDGSSQADELLGLDKVGVHSISLAYAATGASTDAQGNEFRLRGSIVADAPVSATIYDVWLRSVTPGVETSEVNNIEWRCAAQIFRVDPTTIHPCPQFAEPAFCQTRLPGSPVCTTVLTRYAQSGNVSEAGELAARAVIGASATVSHSSCPIRLVVIGPGDVDPMPYPGGPDGWSTATDPAGTVYYRCTSVAVPPPPPPDGGGGTSCGP